MGWLSNYTEREKERIAKLEAQRIIRIEDYHDDICITIDGIKAMSITGEKDKDIATLMELRNEYVTNKLGRHDTAKS